MTPGFLNLLNGRKLGLDIMKSFIYALFMPRSLIKPAAFVSPASYEAALEELESLVQRLESGELPLDQMLSGYQRGAELLKFCRDKLEAVENQIKLLDQGKLRPWTAE